VKKRSGINGSMAFNQYREEEESVMAASKQSGWRKYLAK
jgi:hypothetical protein